jgi:hypothetical protein
MTTLKHMKVMISLNDNGDVLIRAKPNKDFVEKVIKKKDDLADFEHEDEEDDKENDSSKHRDNIFDCSLFLCVCNETLNNNGTFLHFDAPNDEITNMQGVSMNQNYIFFWNLGSVWSLDLRSKEKKKLSLYVSENELATFVKKVRCTSDPERISIRVQQSPQVDCIIIWDMIKDQEIDSYDIDQNALVVQDRHGNPYIAEKDYVIDCMQHCKIKAFHFKIEDFNQENTQFGF